MSLGLIGSEGGGCLGGLVSRYRTLGVCLRSIANRGFLRVGACGILRTPIRGKGWLLVCRGGLDSLLRRGQERRQEGNALG